MALYNISEIAKVLNIDDVSIKKDYTVRYLLTDSRTLISPVDTLFFAIKGERHNGHEFIAELIDRGVKNFVISDYNPDYNKYSDVNFLIVNNVITALQLISAYHRTKFTIPVIGITGSNGKTVLKEWLFQLLSDKKVIRSPKSYNSQIGVPLSVWMLDNDADIAIFEAGISKPSEMNNLQKIIFPSIGIITNIGDPHQENFIDQKHKIIEKLKLFSDSELIIYCKDYQLIENQIQQLTQYENNQTLSWSKKYPADLFINSITKTEDYSVINASYKGKKISFKIPFIDDASIENAIHACLLMIYLGYDNETIAQRMLNLSPVAMRLELKEGINNSIIINDSYNSDIGSLSIALDFVNQQQQHNQKLVILSDILQSGKNPELLYKEVADLINKKNIDRFIGIGKLIGTYKKYFKPDSHFYLDTDEFLDNIQKYNFQNNIVLLKGAREYEFERISNYLQQKIHETVLEINLNAITHNLNFFRSLLKPSTKLMVMVKAFSYGSGIYEIAKLLEYQRVDYLAVAFPDEGIELRKAGISTPILVLNPEVQSYDLMIDNHLEPEIYSFNVLNQFIESVKRRKIKSYPVHIKLDTGMHRLGFLSSEIKKLTDLLKNNDDIKIKSVFSHLAAADEEIHDSFTKQQIRLFEEMSEKIMSELHYPVLRHILNTSGIERFHDAQFDIVRLGIGLYGISKKYNDRLLNVSTLKSSISQIKKVAKGETVGYSRMGKADKDITIAVVPIGYADGLNRRLSNGVGKLLVNNSLAPIIGNICMDMCMIDVTGLNVSEGDEVIVFGDNYPITEMADKLDTIPYEIMTSISRRVKRIYYHE
ncbi:MAG: bifunctional UDP-N-acetylmuramoyl-tripeptide:D-alanyl-D-alanine ligase/alanine racemase [Marinilabiliales bacterium]